MKFNQTKVPTPSKEFVKEQAIEADKLYTENYQFKQPSSVRAPVSPWEAEHIRREDSYYPVSPKEKALVIGSPSNFGHKGAQIQGKTRVSGNPTAHRIGSKSKQ